MPRKSVGVVECVVIRCTVKHVRENSKLITFVFGGVRRDKWIPKSVILAETVHERPPKASRDEDFTAITIMQWFAKKEGMI